MCLLLLKPVAALIVDAAREVEHLRSGACGGVWYIPLSYGPQNSMHCREALREVNAQGI